MAVSTVASLPRSCVLALGLLLAAGPVSAQFVNGSFEDGDFTGWTTTDLTTPHLPLQVSVAGLSDGLLGLLSAPTDGDFSAVNGFDGDGPGTITIAQDVAIPKAASLLLFDFSAEWDLVDFASSTLPRSFAIVVEPEGGGTALQSQEVLHVPASTVDSLLGVTAAVSLKEFAGETVLVKFLWDVPENFSGPAMFDLDHVRLAGKKVAASDVASLKVHMDLQQVGKDTLKLSLEVPADPGFDPDGAGVALSVGDVGTKAALDAKGNASGDGFSLKVSPDPKDPDKRKVMLVLNHADLLADLTASGLTNETTDKGGSTALVPVTVDLGGVQTSRSVLVIWKATQDGVGNAAGKTASELIKAKLAVKLDFASANSDVITLKTSALVQPGFTPDGEEVTVSIGSFSRGFTLDADGQATDGGDSIIVKRDPKNPGRQLLTFKCKERDAQSALAADGLTDADVSKPGDALLLPVNIELDGLNTRLIVPVTWTAKAGASGHAVGKL